MYLKYIGELKKDWKEVKCPNLMKIYFAEIMSIKIQTD